jgi:hypothetical protein
MFSSARTSFREPFFFKVIATAACSIWKQRTANFFDNVNPSFGSSPPKETFSFFLTE